MKVPFCFFHFSDCVIILMLKSTVLTKFTYVTALKEKYLQIVVCLKIQRSLDSWFYCKLHHCAFCCISGRICKSLFGWICIQAVVCHFRQELGVSWFSWHFVIWILLWSERWNLHQVTSLLIPVSFEKFWLIILSPFGTLRFDSDDK